MLGVTLAIMWAWMLFPFSTTMATESDSSPGAFFESLQARLLQDGFDEIHIKTLYRDPRAQLDLEGVALFFVHNEGRLNYDQFLSATSIRRAKAYMQKHRTDLAIAQGQGVAPEIVTAIILVETRLGTYVGKRSILSTLSTIAVLENPHIRRMLWDSLPESRRYTQAQFHQRADQKSAWAYGELKAFLKHTQTEGIDPLSVVGSYAGAMGIAQFMPSNVLLLGKDGDQDGRIDLFNHADAIASIANYLRHYGWKPGIDRDKAYKVLLKYNYSKYYVNTLLNIYDRLKG